MLSEIWGPIKWKSEADIGHQYQSISPEHAGKRLLGTHLEIENIAPVEDRERLVLYDPTSLQQGSSFEIWHVSRFVQIVPTHFPALPVLVS